MPIRRERRRLYPADWDRISFRIRAIRAGWRCEWTKPDGRRCEAVQGKSNPFAGSTVRLAAAHIDHDETGRDPARILCLCQFHHLTGMARIRATGSHIGLCTKVQVRAHLGHPQKQPGNAGRIEAGIRGV